MRIQFKALAGKHSVDMILMLFWERWQKTLMVIDFFLFLQSRWNGALAQLVQSACLTGMRPLVRFQHVPL